jgi:hypothetical protein
VTRDARELGAIQRPRAVGQGAEQGDAGDDRQVTEVLARREVGDGGPGSDDDARATQAARRQRFDGQRRRVERAEPGRGDDEHGCVEQAGDVGEGAGRVVGALPLGEGHEQASRALDEHEVVGLGEQERGARGVGWVQPRPSGPAGGGRGGERVGIADQLAGGDRASQP